MSVESIFSDHYDDLSIEAQVHLKKIYEWYLVHPDGFLPKGVELNDKQLKVLIYNISLLSAWAIDDELPLVILDDFIKPLSDN
ncbi:MAG TPA: hypothetical protein VL443_24495 [Cyclobacteriaceae bacterium]|jgi:hypothetical protein|nr:hypothetical protein [Cyclobacteriaceae bacterium]